MLFKKIQIHTNNFLNTQVHIKSQICPSQPTFLLATREFHNKAASCRRKLRSPLAPVISICVVCTSITHKTRTAKFATRRELIQPTQRSQGTSKTFKKLAGLYNHAFLSYACADIQQQQLLLKQRAIFGKIWTLIDNVNR